jgi:hypothetical protein
MNRRAPSDQCSKQHTIEISAQPFHLAPPMERAVKSTLPKLIPLNLVQPA